MRVAIVLLACALTLPFIGWGVPHATAADRTKPYAVDDLLPLGPLADLSNMFIEAKPDWHVGYPWWHYAVLAGAEAPYLLYLKMTGRMAKPTGVFPFGLEDPVLALKMLTLIGRLVTVIMAAWTLLLTESWVRRLFSKEAALFAVGFVALSQLFVYYGRTGNVDMPALFWTSLGLRAYAIAVTEGVTMKRIAAVALFAGLAMATKDQAIVVFLPLAVALLRRKRFVARGIAWDVRVPAVGLVVSLIAYGVGTGMVLNPHRQIEHIRALFFHPEQVTAAVVYWPAAPKTFAARSRLLGDFVWSLAAMLTPAVFLLAIIGVFRAAKRTFGTLVLATVLPLLFLMLTWPTGVVVRRYFLPFVPIAAAFAGYALASILADGHKKLAVTIAALALLFQAAIVADMTYAQVADTREAAAAYLRAHTGPNDRLEYFGHEQKLPPFDADLLTRRIAGREHWEGESGHGPRMLEYLRVSGPEFFLEAPDWTSKPGLERSADCPPEVYDALLDGSIGYHLVAAFPPPRLFGRFERPRLDNPSIAPPIRIFAREEVRQELESGVR